MKTSTCKFCGETVIWVKTRSDKNMPVDVDPSSDGNFVIHNEDEDNPRVLRMNREAAERYTGPLYRCHFETCSARKGADGENT